MELYYLKGFSNPNIYSFLTEVFWHQIPHFSLLENSFYKNRVKINKSEFCNKLLRLEIRSNKKSAVILLVIDFTSKFFLDSLSRCDINPSSYPFTFYWPLQLLQEVLEENETFSKPSTTITAKRSLDLSKRWDWTWLNWFLLVKDPSGKDSPREWNEKKAKGRKSGRHSGNADKILNKNIMAV